MRMGEYPFAGSAHHLRITTNDVGDLSPRLCRFAADHNWLLQELRVERPTLEDLFVQITEAEDAPAAQPAMHSA